MLTLNELAKVAEKCPKELERMKNCLKEAGRLAFDAEITLAWARYSDSACSKWLSLPSDDDTLTKTLLANLPDADPAPRGSLSAALREAGDGDTGNLLVELPSVLVSRLGWKTGDKLSMCEDSQGRLTLRRFRTSS